LTKLSNEGEVKSQIRSIIWDFFHSNGWSDPDDFSLALSRHIFKLMSQSPLSSDSVLKITASTKTSFFRTNRISKKDFATILVSDVGDKLMRVTENLRKTGAQKPTEPVTILFLSANPKDTDGLRLEEEIREIEQSILRAQKKDRFNLIKKGAVRVSDLQFYLTQDKPAIVHFCGHGNQQGQIILENNIGQAISVPPAALERAFKAIRDNVRCVVLNACFSYAQACAISKHIDCVVGMSSSIQDEAAIAFSSAFYLGIASGASVKVAFDQGITEIMLWSIPNENVPRLICRRGINPAKVFLL
jgi:hypothetical protein